MNSRRSSTPSWRLPAAALDAEDCSRGRALLAALFLLAMVLASLVLPVWLTALPVPVLLIDLWCYRRRLAGRRLVFDGRDWWLQRGDTQCRLNPVGDAYCGPLLLCLHLRGEAFDSRCLLWRRHFCRERWRRLVLAARYSSGRSTVSTAWGASSG